VRAGGHAVVWQRDGRARYVFPIPDDDDPLDLGYWALLDMNRSRFTRETTGPYRGLATVVVSRDCHELVRERAERDAVWRGATRVVRFDCLACGACCKDNRVELEPEDVERFAAAGRAELARAPYARRDEGKIVLRLLRDKRCRHLGASNACAIYAFRPAACAQFPVGSECCLYAREEELGIVDGDRGLTST